MPNRRPAFRKALAGLACAVIVYALATVPVVRLQAAQPPGLEQTEATPFTEQAAAVFNGGAMKEIREAIVRLPLAAILGTALALRPRKRGAARQTVLVVQTQIMLAVVGAVIMLVVGNSLSRAFGIVGAAGLVRYRSTIDDPKEAVVMLCALGAGLAAGVGLYLLAPFATFFMAAVLWAVEYFEPPARKYFELSVATPQASHFRPKVEGVLHGLGLEYELLTESDDAISYSVSAPLDVRTRDVSDTMRLLAGDGDMSIEWSEKKAKK
ncbi:MAG: hypothetical protein U0Q55_09245 [Vicinamibacterales bacterium]